MSKRKPTSSPKKNKGQWKHLVKKARREAAEIRQAIHNKLSPQEKLAKLDRYGFVAAKERAKIQRLIKGESK